jgi:hypothetical protein
VRGDEAALGRALRLLVQDARLRPGAGWHPSPEELAAYHLGRLSSGQSRRVQLHLGLCCACPELLLELERFLAPVSPEAVEETAVSWRDLLFYVAYRKP